jgi:hypothetical protein
MLDAGLDDQVHLVLGEGRHGFAIRPGAIVAVHLDPVGAVARLIANDAHERLPVRFLGALRNRPVGRKPFGAYVPVATIARVVTIILGPGMIPWLTACLSPTSA